LRRVLAPFSSLALICVVALAATAQPVNPPVPVPSGPVNPPGTVASPLPGVPTPPAPPEALPSGSPGATPLPGASLAREWSWQRKALSGFANLYVRALLRLGVRDVTAGFKLWRATALTTIDIASIRSNGYSFQVEMNYRTINHGLKVVELPIHFVDRAEGESKMTWKVQLESALMPISLRKRAR